ncbi:hypothetical protein Srut_12640 [Streptomyces rutgersensis]|uniref:Uncharacterized protein n=2 Tax=Streptomyces TaxID=1883 RepID=A0A380P243_STRGR|nr:hypothetical protein Srut_12640 [Streptomyces rutgersensis]SUP58075.1 Uncharacterised protein [Streptomyces griseus]
MGGRMNNAASSGETAQAGQRPPTGPADAPTGTPRQELAAPSGAPQGDPAHPPVTDRPPAGQSAADDAPELTTLRQKVEYMVEKTFPGQRISGRYFSDLVRSRGGSLSHSYFSNILAGKVTQPSEEILKALGLGFGVDWRFFKEESEVVDDVVAGLQFLVKRRTGEINGVAGRGLDAHGLPPELLQFALSLLEQSGQRDEPGGDGRPGDAGG